MSRPLTHVQTFLRGAPRSGNPATLRTHQVGSRHVGCATPAAFRHRKHAHKRRARAPLCQLIRCSAVPACMKRSSAELLLCTWSGCGGRLNRVVVATVKRDGGGDAPHCALSRCASINGKACACSSAVASIGRGAQSALLRGASLWAAECGMHVIWPCGGVRPREMRVEGRRKPWKPNVINKMRVVVVSF